jgi:23S rRNA (cytidine1920-2'-O)/16S rRNA (cytidine1409-2'-O)-methyltransferase
LPVIRPFLKENADYICLIKPQFEAGREQVGKKGIVRDPAVHASVIRACLDAAAEDGYAVQGLDWSPIRGADGNIEFLCHLRNTESAEHTPDSLITAVVEAAHGGQP